MSRPDLETEDGRARYRRELRGVGRPIRLGGLALIVLGAVVVLGVAYGRLEAPQGVVMAGYGILAAGWVLVIAAVFMRTRHHRRRMAEGL